MTKAECLEHLKRRYPEVQSLYKIAKEVSRSYQTVQGYAKLIGLEVRKPGGVRGKRGPNKKRRSSSGNRL